MGSKPAYDLQTLKSTSGIADPFTINPASKLSIPIFPVHQDNTNVRS
jgi:hypothetical protein